MSTILVTVAIFPLYQIIPFSISHLEVRCTYDQAWKECHFEFSPPFSLVSVTEKVWESGSEDDFMPATTSATADSGREAEVAQTLKTEKLSPIRSSKGAKQASLRSFKK